MSIISNKYAYLNVLKYGRQLFFQKTTGFSFSINNILKRNYVMYGLKNNKSILTSVTRLVNPLYSQYMFGGNKTTRILWNDFYVNNTMNRLKLRQKRNLFKHFLFKMRSKTFFQPEVIHNLSSDKKSNNILINDLNSVKKLYITRKISQKFHGFNFIKNKSKIQQSLLFPKLKKNFRKSAFRRFFLRKKSTIHKQFSRKYPVRSFT